MRGRPDVALPGPGPKIAPEGAQSDGSCSSASVDTDIDEGVECKRTRSQAEQEVSDSDSSGVAAETAPPALGDAAAAGAEEGDDSDLAARYRHPPGSWTVWQNLWLYITKTPGYPDLKAHMKTPLRNPITGMGRHANFTTALSPHHYGDTWDDPKRTMLLLRAWAISRARFAAWANEREGRKREVAVQLRRLEADIRAEGQSRPLLGTAKAERWLRKWVPDIVNSICAQQQQQQQQARSTDSS